MTPPPGWTPPPNQAPTVYGTSGQTLQAGGITFTATRLAGSPATCAPPGANQEWLGFEFVASWTGFSLALPILQSGGVDVHGTCIESSEVGFVSGGRYQAWMPVPAGTAASGGMGFAFFPDGFGPGYVFAYR